METRNSLEESLSSTSAVQKGAQVASSPGVLVFSRTLQILHVNRRALELTGQSHQVTTGPISVALSTPLIELRAKVQEALARRTAAGVWDPFEVRRAVGEVGSRVLLRGFGLPDRKASDRSRIIIVLEEQAGLQEEDIAEHSEGQFYPVNLEEAVA
ncbi:MAG: hypothetical protein ACREIH_05310 [Nitrospiraceae bacterium]